MIAYSKLPAPFEPLEAAAIFALGLLDPGDLVRIALALIERGFDSPELRRLAAAGPTDEDVAAWWLRSLDQLGIAHFGDQQGAAEWYVRQIAKRIASRNLAAIDGARAIWRVSLVLDPAKLPAADPFVYAASEWDDRPGDRSHFEREIILQAERTVGVRRGG